MSAVDLQDSIVEGGIRSINFFNGRLLTARDLSSEQSANREADRRLGQAVGDGIAFGLEISAAPNPDKDAPVITVQSGLAVNRSGQTLRLANKTDVALARQASADSVASPIFTECLPLQSGIYVAGAGLYLLTLAPAQSSEGRAATNSLESATATCNTDANVSAVQFRLLSLNAALNGGTLADQDHLRNHIAYQCFGVADTNEFAANPFLTTTANYGLLDELRENLLTDCDVPLGILYWTLSDGIRFIDMWSVRRRLIARSVYQKWDILVGDRRLGEAEASFLQFQDQLQSIVTTEAGTLSGLRADQRFEFLPAAGFLPVGAGQLDWQTFLGPLALATTTATDESLLRSILHRSLSRDPIRVGSFDQALRPNEAPPLPVDVYVVPDHDDFVLFAHSSKSRIRVFLTPSPTSGDGLVIEAQSSVTSMSIGAVAPNEGSQFEIVAAEPDAFILNVDVPGFLKPDLLPVQGISGRTADVEIALVILPRGSVLVTVTQKDTGASINDKVNSVTATDANDVVVAGALDANGNWLIADLQTGSYDINVFAGGFETGVIQGVAVSAGQQQPLSVQLTPVPVQKQRPDLCIVTTVTVKTFKSEQVRLCMQLESISFNQKPTGEMVRAAVTAEGDQWLSSWREWLSEQYQGKQIEISATILYVNAALLLGSKGTLGLEAGTLGTLGTLKKAATISRPGLTDRIGLKTGTGIKIFEPPPQFQAIAFFGVVSIPLTMTAAK